MHYSFLSNSTVYRGGKATTIWAFAFKFIFHNLLLHQSFLLKVLFIFFIFIYFAREFFIPMPESILLWGFLSKEYYQAGFCGDFCQEE